MEVISLKNIHKPAAQILFSGLVVSIAVGTLIAINPVMSERMARAWFTPSVHITPSKSGLASIELGQHEPASGLGDAVTAGDRLRLEMNFVSASEK